MTGFAFEISQLILLGLLLVLMTATVDILFRRLAKIYPNEVTDIQFFLTFIIVIVPFVMFILIGGLIVLYDDVVAVALGSSQLLLSSPFAPSWQMLLAAVLIYMGLTVWPWTRWRKLAISQ